VVYDISELENIRELDLSNEDERKEIAPQLMQTVSKGGKSGIKSIQIIIENNLSYYARNSSDEILNGIKNSNNMSYVYAIAQLTEFVYDNHGSFSQLPDIMLEILDINPNYITTRKSYRTKLYRFYDKNKEDNIKQIAKDEFNDELEILQESDGTDIRENVKTGQRVRLKESQKRGIVKSTPDFVEFELYEKIEKKALISNSDAFEYLNKSINIVYDMIKSLARKSSKSISNDFNIVIEKLIDIAENYLGDIAEKTFETLTTVSSKLTERQREQLENTLIESLRDGFNLNPIQYLIKYVIKNKGNVFDSKKVKDNIKKYYNIKEKSRFLLQYETDKEKRKAYIALCTIDNISKVRIKLVKYGFTQFYNTRNS
jgi:hypothetical protein